MVPRRDRTLDFGSPEPSIDFSCDNPACLRSKNGVGSLKGGTAVHRFLLMILLVGMFATVAWSQEDIDAEADETVQPEAGDEAEAEEQDENVVDDEYYQDVDDEDFRPSEDVPADQSIAFPTDI
jgi:hypothetical protein